ncbi:hypothetical protein PILCRDRAFT_196256 [Piloderma croceum F 1598]|uniref:Uncharacterized protein n=1 Tax=Piloderma croceum (strain F 1598) TaxID=765440 RepID=A0A0C3G0P6_PILCF|nr:hypothetical protein PILCRDRAFT_196256 [Piloderma croceum F 1598]
MVQICRVATVGSAVKILHGWSSEWTSSYHCATPRRKTHAPSQPLDNQSPLDLTQSLHQLYMQNFPNTAPSSQGVPSAFAELQRDEEHIIRLNRPPSAASATPSTLPHPIFGKFINECENHEPTAADNKLVLTLSAAMSGFFNGCS